MRWRTATAAKSGWPTGRRIVVPCGASGADAGCSEQQAKDWLASIGVTEPPNGNGKKK